jgi:secondary thiamine-phosphate synthase enzyme
MKTYRHELIFTLPARRGFVNITSKVQDCVDESRVMEGLVLVNSMHISSSIFINDNESAPEKPHSQYRHNDTGEDNADAHLKRTIMGREVVVAITEGKLDFGPWEQIFYGEFDGLRRKRVLVKVIGD